MFASRAPLILPAMRPEVYAPSIMPPIIGMKNQPNWRSLRSIRSITNAGAEAMYRNNELKLNAPETASRWKRGLAKTPQSTQPSQGGPPIGRAYCQERVGQYR